MIDENKISEVWKTHICNTVDCLVCDTLNTLTAALRVVRAAQPVVDRLEPQGLVHPTLFNLVEALKPFQREMIKGKQ